MPVLYKDFLFQSSRKTNTLRRAERKFLLFHSDVSVYSAEFLVARVANARAFDNSHTPKTKLKQ